MVEKLGDHRTGISRLLGSAFADADDTEATLQAMVAEILRYRHPRACPLRPIVLRASFRNERLLLLGHMPDHNVVMRHVRSGVTPIEVEADVVDWSGEPRRV